MKLLAGALFAIALAAQNAGPAIDYKLQFEARTVAWQMDKLQQRYADLMARMQQACAGASVGIDPQTLEYRCLAPAPAEKN